MKNLITACKKTPRFEFFDKKTSKTRLSKFLKLRSLIIVNDCFKNESNAEFGVFLQRLISTVLLIILSVLVNAQDLSNIINNLPEGANSLVLSADVNIDGFPDVFIAGESVADDFVELYRNNGDSTFFDLGLSIPYLSDASACFADLNNDTYVDLLYTGIDATFNYRFYIYINQQNNTFIELTHTIPGIRYGAIQCHDLDHDGWQDIFISGYTSSGNIALLYKNNGNQTFTNTGFTFEALRNCDAVIADFDHNNYPDIIYSGLNGSLTVETFYYQNQGKMQFVEKANNLPESMLGGIESCDVNNDGFTDLVIFGKDNSNAHISKIYRNNAGLSFTYLDELQGIREGALKASDFNNDGYVDLILVGSNETDTYTTELYTNNAGTGFTLETDTITALGYSDALWFDFNQDNKNDLLLCGTTVSSSKSLSLSSNIAVANQLPLMITGLNSQTSADTVCLSWNMGIDNETASNGLSYDIYMQTDVTDSVNFYPTADLLSGKRYINNQGSLSTNSFCLDNLPDGKYWWTVQSVDAAFAGSPFATADTFNISQPINLGNDTTICYGDSIEFSLLENEGTAEWFISDNPTTPFSTEKIIKIEITKKDTIWVKLTKDYGDQITDTIIIDVFSLPLVDLGDDIAICYGSTVNLTLGSASDTIDWFTLSNTYTDENSSNFNHPFYFNDEIYAELTDINGCKNSDTLLIEVLALPIIDLVNDTTLCLNDTLKLDIGTASDSINWYSLTNSDELLNSNTFEYQVLINNIFQVECFDNNACVNYDTINIFARSLPIADAGEDKLICEGYDVTIGPEIIISDWVYFWDANDISEQNLANPTVHPSSDTKYFLTVSDQYSCVGSDSMIVEINPVGNIDIGIDRSICIGESISIGGEPTAEGSILPYAYQWSPVNTLSEPASANPIASPSETTTYSLVVFTGNCPIDTLETTVTVNLLPEIQIMNDTLAGFNENISLWASGGTEYEWMPKEYLDNSFIQNPITSLEHSVHFTVMVTNEFNCSDTAGVNIFVKNEIFIPELFTPNNDGNNDYFKVYGFGIKEINLIVFNEMGVPIFESNNLNEILNIGWDGNNNGYQVKDGKYFWKIDGEFYSGEKLLFNGKNIGVITILR
ncbi:MAG: FG-GAP-like repeat-containing protein [Bacteroidales bacterium]|jgi:gliding motility-associated-like protein|nr:FG-GAP-like repeat-containing protein [Bacteroidales bacterium]